MNACRKGSATTAVVGVLAVLLVGGVIWYFTSDVFSTKVNEAVKQGTTWTPEQIAKDPVNYLNYVEQQTNKALQDLKASRIAMAQSKAELETKQARAKAKIEVGEKTINELIELYKTSDSSSTFTVVYNGEKRDKAWVQSNVVSLTNQVKMQKDMLSAINNAMDKVSAQNAKIDAAEAKANEQLAQIGVNKETIKLANISDDLTKKLASMQGVVDATVSVASENKGSGLKLDDLADKAPPAVNTAEFDKILAGHTK